MSPECNALQSEKRVVCVWENQDDFGTYYPFPIELENEGYWGKKPSILFRGSDINDKLGDYYVTKGALQDLVDMVGATRSSQTCLSFADYGSIACWNLKTRSDAMDAYYDLLVVVAAREYLVSLNTGKGPYIGVIDNNLVRRAREFVEEATDTHYVNFSSVGFTADEAESAKAMYLDIQENRPREWPRLNCMQEREGPVKCGIGVYVNDF